MFGLTKEKPVLVRIEANLSWLVYQDPGDRHFIAVSPALNATAMGDTYAELQLCIGETIQLLFESLLKRGELDAFLRERGWQPLTPLPSRSARAQFDVPFDLSQKARFEELVPA